jgi:AcrR family transcriptional regulator
VSEPSKSDRGSRRKAKTRAKLLAAAQTLMSERGLHEVNIQDITELADVGLGTFYNHFESKGDVLKALADQFLQRYMNELKGLTERLEDPAEVISVSYRYTLSFAKKRTIFPIVSQLPRGFVIDLIEARVAVDINQGVASGRFHVDNLAAFISFVSSMTMGVMENFARGKLSEEDAQHTTRYCLRLLGISESESKELSEKPIPELEEQNVAD